MLELFKILFSSPKCHLCGIDDGTPLGNDEGGPYSHWDCHIAELMGVPVTGKMRMIQTKNESGLYDVSFKTNEMVLDTKEIKPFVFEVL